MPFALSPCHSSPTLTTHTRVHTQHRAAYARLSRGRLSAAPLLVARVASLVGRKRHLTRPKRKGREATSHPPLPSEPWILKAAPTPEVITIITTMPWWPRPSRQHQARRRPPPPHREAPPLGSPSCTCPPPAAPPSPPRPLTATASPPPPQ